MVGNRTNVNVHFRSPKGVRLAQKMDYPAYGVMGPRSYDNNVVSKKLNNAMPSTRVGN